MKGRKGGKEREKERVGGERKEKICVRSSITNISLLSQKVLWIEKGIGKQSFFLIALKNPESLFFSCKAVACNTVKGGEGDDA